MSNLSCFWLIVCPLHCKICFCCSTIEDQCCRCATSHNAMQIEPKHKTSNILCIMIYWSNYYIFPMPLSYRALERANMGSVLQVCSIFACEASLKLDCCCVYSEVFSQAGLLHPLLLPKLYPTLFDLYALYNEKEDEVYWKRVLHWNRQPDVGLMAYLGLAQ